ncbi:MAG: TIGR03619 family F420-dependent LLM class oxidoreductase [Gammaproteobacteria bacterium]|nr:TIGR03619 family F420-dependent LLM class oxidoreductase [Gammaproteobacteria bacterium]
MKFGISIPNNQGIASVRELVAIAVEAEQLGYDSGWVSEHLFHASYVAARLGDRPYHEALVVLTAVATLTERLRLGTSVLVLPWHHPARLAKQIASLDQLSGGRVVLGVGVAQTPDEFANLGVPYATRGAVTDDAIRALRALWSEDVPAYHGEHFRFEGLRFEPKPRQAQLPVLIGGNSPRALRRVRELGDGWHAMSLSVEEVRAAMPGTGGKPGSIRLVLEFADVPPTRAVNERRSLKGTPEELVAQVRGYAAAGIEEIVVDANLPDVAATRACYRRFRDEVMAVL